MLVLVIVTWLRTNKICSYYAILLDIPEYIDFRNSIYRNEILQLKAKGYTNIEIAVILNISERTVYYRIKEIKDE